MVKKAKKQTARGRKKARARAGYPAKMARSSVGAVKRALTKSGTL
jgi:hypothetical protein